MNAKKFFLSLTLFPAIIIYCQSASGQPTNSLGIFSGQIDIGRNTKPGSTKYLSQTGQYVITGSGENIWGAHDSFHYVYKKMKGDFILYTRISFATKDKEPHQKIGWMIRSSLRDNAPHVSIAAHADGLTSMQFRKTTGANTEEIQVPVTHADILELERNGDTFTMRIANYGDTFVTRRVINIDMKDEIYIGLFVCAHNTNARTTGIFRDVRITIPFSGNPAHAYPMKLGSNLEVLDIATGNRKIVYSVPYSIQAPNWTKDGNFLLFNNDKGQICKFDLATHKTALINTGDVKRNNNDHVISFNGNMIGLSSNVNTLGGSIIYTVPIAGGTPTQITPRGPSYLHGWSPNGKYLVFCGQRNNEFDVYKIPSTGGREIRLTYSKGLDDGPEYSPDGKYIYFNSVRSGSMQIWRMKPDGSDKEQITQDGFNNWFPHVSPDGKWIVFISFLKSEAAPEDHPPYKHVYIRMIPANGGKPRVLAYLYGGQGSMNTPSWSPDSKKIAFISNTQGDGRIIYSDKSSKNTL